MHFLSYMKRANRMNKPVKLTQKRASNNLNTHIKIWNIAKLYIKKQNKKGLGDKLQAYREFIYLIIEPSVLFFM